MNSIDQKIAELQGLQLLLDSNQGKGLQNLQNEIVGLKRILWGIINRKFNGKVCVRSDEMMLSPLNPDIIINSEPENHQMAIFAK